MTAETVAALMLGLGVGGILLELMKRTWDAISGRGKVRRDEIARAWEQADEQRRNRDEEATRRRIAEEHASQLRRLALEAPCIPNEDIPQYPAYPPHRRSS